MTYAEIIEATECAKILALRLSRCPDAVKTRRALNTLADAVRALAEQNRAREAYRGLQMLKQSRKLIDFRKTLTALEALAEQNRTRGV